MSMKSRKMLSARLVLSVMLLASSGGYVFGQSAPQTTAAPHWGYIGEHGPKHWPGLCQTGTKQTPIALEDELFTKRDLPPIKFTYAPTALKMVNNGHTIQVNYDKGSYIEIDGERYDLVQFHF